MIRAITGEASISYDNFKVQQKALVEAYRAYSQGYINKGNGIMKSRRKAFRTCNFRNLGILLEKLNSPKL